MTKVLITGTGLISLHLSFKLKEKGYEVAFLSRSIKTDINEPQYLWNLKQETIDKEALIETDYIIHLAGANIGSKKWTKERKKEIIESRVKSANLIFQKLKEYKLKPKAFITASAIGFYGALSTKEIYTEDALPANDFLGQTCKSWEDAASQFQTMEIRTVKIRTGVVLSKDSEALKKMAMPVKMGFGSAIGTGKQYMPWIHIDDLCSVYIKAIEDSNLNGVYNAVSPEYITNKDFMRKLARYYKKPFWFPNIPSLLLKIFFGEMASMLLKGSRVSSQKIVSTGYKYSYPTLDMALKNIINE